MCVSSKNTRFERERYKAPLRYKNKKVRAFEDGDEDDDDDDSRFFFFFGFFSECRAMMMNNTTKYVSLRSFRTIADEKRANLSSRTLCFFLLLFSFVNRASKRERGKEEDARARYGFFFGFSTSSDDGVKCKCLF